MISSAEYNYSSFRISKTENLLDSAHRYKEQRLQALKLSPSSFASSYELESTFTDEYWISRLTQPERETFICAGTRIPESDDAVDHFEPEWVAQVTFLGPQSKEHFALSSESDLEDTDTSENDVGERWQMLGLFNHPAHRGKGIAKALTRTALNCLISHRCEPNNVLVRLMVKPGMQATIEFYRQLGFVEVGRGTLAAALIANGDRELLPEGYERQEKYTACTSHVMEQRFWRNANKT
ncbi:hypothetical protein ASPVEDRAFT_33425 [Aspergillus versicolor CBS 583.65]|uniref:N-acetyltransferase domain-containing protein n=1 Tax=Aspergillus versicolor CBS 583.65 TaxID=1036611 RepID=A0A1L9Q0A0_ASPVE|nr:uncharacterized protein ASPVEDRAFT_33425 [Aspergillus versicolor CBS 583.65]OJJ07191.1 hypothetical protein ASPVEDRAFT_33425 [Aspergillus versicolor CBS 583.65]